MSQSGLTAEQSVSWPSEGISEVPFRVYTDQEQYHREQERLFQGPTWQYLCLEVELGKLGDFVSTTVGAEGLALGDGITIADGKDAFVDALVSTLGNPGAAAEQAERGRARVMERYE